MIQINNKHSQVLALAMRNDTHLICLEGTIRSSKTVLAIMIFANRCKSSKEQVHIVSAKDYDAINNNILHSNGCGLLDLWGSEFQLKKDRIGGYYLAFENIYHQPSRILLAGYSNASSWKKILGGTIGNIYVDEVNIAEKTFIDECFARQTSASNPFMIWTLNGDNPDHFIYKDYINRCKPLLQVPTSILKEMNEVPNEKGWFYYHFKMEDNPSMTPEKIERAKSIYPFGSYYYNIKVLGLRGRAEGTICADYLNDDFISLSKGLILDHTGTPELDMAGNVKNTFIKYSIGIDLGNNINKRGTIITFSGFTRGFEDVVVISSKQCEKTETNELVREIATFVENCYNSIAKKNLIDAIWVDGYGAVEVLMLTLRSEIQKRGITTPVKLVEKFGKDKGRRNRLDTLLLLISSKRIYFRPQAKQTMVELTKLVYADDGLPLDNNTEEMDYYDSLMYSVTSSIALLNRRL